MPNNESVPSLPEIFIGYAAVQERVNLYLQNKHLLLSAALVESGHSKQETKSIWFSKEHVQTWLDEINYLNADGMRIYLGQYIDDESAFAAQLCLLVVPTRPTGSNGHADVIIENEPDYEARVQAGQTRSRGISVTESNENSLPKGYNYGAPCPPICP